MSKLLQPTVTNIHGMCWLVVCRASARWMVSTGTTWWVGKGGGWVGFGGCKINQRLQVR
jgi:hypothetical protein